MGEAFLKTRLSLLLHSVTSIHIKISKLWKHQFLEFGPVDASQEGAGGLGGMSMGCFL